MATSKKRIATYVPDETVKKFRVVSALKNKSMSEYTETLIQEVINQYEAEHGPIEVEEEQ